MGRRVLAFFLGFIFGIIFVFGALALGLYIAATSISPADIFPDSQKFLGDLANMSLLDVYNSISSLYNEKLGIKDANNRYFTFGEFCEHYNIDPVEMFGGKQVPQEVLDVPIFELIGGDREQAESQIRVSVIPAVLNMFLGGGSDEDGSSTPLFPDSVMVKLAAFSVTDLKAEDGLATVFADVRISEVAMGMLPLERDEENAMIWALGQSKLGPLLGGVDGNMMLQFKEGGAFDEMGKLPLVELLGDSSQLLNAFFKNNALADLIDEEGNLNPDGIMNGVYLGELVGLQREHISEENIEKYAETELFDDNVKLLFDEEANAYALQTADGTYAAKLTCKEQAEDHVHELGCYGYVWYGTTAASEENDSDLVIDEVHYPLAKGIYAAIADVTIGELTGGDSSALVDKMMDIPLNELLEGQEMSGIFENISDMTIGELINGGIDGMYIGQLLGFVRNEIAQPQGEVTELYAAYPPADDEKPVKYVIKDDEGNVAALSDDGETWYEGKLTCIKEEHVHTAECGADDEYTCGKEEHQHDVSGCYGFVWYEQCTQEHDHESELWIDETPYIPVDGMMEKLSNKQISELNDLDEMIKELTLRDVLGEDVPDVFASLQDTPIGELNDAINDMYLGDLLSLRRRPLNETELNDYTVAVQDINGEEIGDILSKKEGDVVAYAKQVDGVWYEARMSCIETEHIHDDSCSDGSCGEEEHVHDASCFGFVWYEKCENAEEGHTHDGEWVPENDNPDGEPYVPKENMMGKLADEQIKNLKNLDETVKKLTLKDVLGEDIPGMLKSLQDTPIGKLDEEIDNLYLGQLLEYRRKDSAEMDDFNGYDQTVIELDGEPVVKSNGEKYVRLEKDVWYQAELTCTKEVHVHGDECEAAGAGYTCGKEEHTHDENCYGFVWYKLCDDNSETHVHGENGEWQPKNDNENGDYYTVADGMMGKLANEKVSNLSNLDETVQTFTLQDVLGDSVPDMLTSLKDTPINQLNDAIDNVYLGDFLKYKRRPTDNADDYETLYKDGNVEVRQKDGAYTKTENGENWYEATLTCENKETDHEHTANCYDFVWYELLADDHVHNDNEWVDEGPDAPHYAPKEGMMGKLAREKVGEMGDLDETVQSFTLQDVMGENVPDMLQSIKDTQIKDLNHAINGMYLGDFLQYRRRTVEELGKTAENYNAKTLSADTGDVMLDGEGNAIKQDADWYEAHLTCTDEHEHTADCYGFVWYKQCETEHDHADEWQPNDDGVYYIVADGMMGKLANEKVDDLGNLDDTIQSFTLRDVMGDTVPDALKSLADTPIGKLGDAMETMYLGAFLKYVKKPVRDTANFSDVENTESTVRHNAETDAYVKVENGVWYDATLNCTKTENGHTHTADCYRFNWYTIQCTAPELHTDDSHDDECYVAADKLIGRLARLKVNELDGDTVIDTVNDTPLGEVLNLENSNGLLKELANVKIGELSSELDAVYVGVAMSYKRKEMSVDINTLTRVAKDANEKHTHWDKIYRDDAGNYYFHDVKHDVYYETKLTCKESHEHNEFNCYGFVWYNCNPVNDSDTSHEHGSDDTCVAVTGLNGKISNLRIDELNGESMTKIATTLTIGDLIDSGMMEIKGEENQYKLAVLYCNNEATLSGYVNAKRDNIYLTYEQYWRDVHGIDRTAELTAEQEQHKNVWKEVLLKDFVETLLSSF